MSDAKSRAYGVGVQPSEQVDGDSDVDVRCWRCGRYLAELLTRPWVIKCGRCKARNEGQAGYHRARVGAFIDGESGVS